MTLLLTLTLYNGRTLLASQQPVLALILLASQHPALASQHPALASQQPALASQQPALASQQPALASQQPAH